ncbi:hypothetical protein ACQX0N_04685 [Clostridium tepidum]|uniref:Uncharacterized protein n=1 Tax=Clostridium tepidum TaxID=1962263 RepID=A0A1S9I2K8_9CLOT|nr:hypothetical protein [Clostridium tepidum]MCR1933743.1 hypothetical protein [Clostridium tepidum]MDU6876732.1 hypothetical protein [Clostridium botulinum]OOO63680.1 hypothetical protein BS637_01235 [Clostridium tepidum]OOO64553.1 hypothetical protein BS638_10565 [Clostridium tepidum]
MLDRGFIQNGYVYNEYGDRMYFIEDIYIYNLNNMLCEFYIKDNLICQIEGTDKYWLNNNSLYFLGKQAI